MSNNFKGTFISNIPIFDFCDRCSCIKDINGNCKCSEVYHISNTEIILNQIIH